MMLNEQHNFQWQMQQLKDLMNVKMQMILLMMTLSLNKEKELWSRIRLIIESSFELTFWTQIKIESSYSHFQLGLPSG